MNFIGNFFLIPLVKKIENWLSFDEVTTTSLVATFLEHCVYYVATKCIVVVLFVFLVLVTLNHNYCQLGCIQILLSLILISGAMKFGFF